MEHVKKIYGVARQRSVGEILELVWDEPDLSGIIWKSMQGNLKKWLNMNVHVAVNAHIRQICTR